MADRPAAESPPYTPGETYFTASPIAQIAPRPARSVSAHPTATDPGRLFREYLDRHHYLGYRAPYGAQLRYWVRPAQPELPLLAALLFTSAAWRMAPRDSWIGWSDSVRQRNLLRVVNHSRFLILPFSAIRFRPSFTPT